MLPGPFVTAQPLLVSVRVAIAEIGPESAERTEGKAFCVSGAEAHPGAPETCVWYWTVVMAPGSEFVGVYPSILVTFAVP